MSATSEPAAVTTALKALHQRFAAAGIVLRTEYDTEWASSCELGQPESADGVAKIRWQPVPRWDSSGHLPADFAGLENALQAAVHPDFKAYFSSFWSGSLESTATDGHVSLLQLWNPSDRDRLIENLIGHVLEQRRARGPLSLFFACTEADSDLILTLHNSTGEVLLEQPGRKPLRTVAASLTAFIDSLVPAGS
ncbi:MAG: SecY-interacting protein Syd [Pseudomonadales bacterium]